MKIALIQLNTLVGDIEGNTKKIIQFIQKAKTAGAELVLFPELAVTGYPPRDLLELPYIIEKNKRAILQVAEVVDDVAVLLGAVEPNPDTIGKPLFNSAYWLENRQIRGTFRKSLLPFYDVFDETRYFEPASTRGALAYKEQTWGISICEDFWADPTLWKRPVYSVDPVSDLIRLGSTVLINISASPYSMGKFALRKEILKRLAINHGVPVIYVNQVGGNDELIFDGGSMVLNEKGEVMAQASFFKEGMTLVDLNQRMAIPAKVPHEMALLKEALICGLKDYVRKCGFKKVALGLSGGIDSALVAHLAVKALGSKNVVGLLMPSRYTSRQSNVDAKRLSKNLKIKTRVAPVGDIQKVYEHLFKKMFGKKKPDTTEENIQARIRGNLLMALSNKEGYLVLSTGNKSELSVGYCTLYGDMSGGLAIISDLPKTLVYQLARFMNKKGKPIPEPIFIRPPTAELKPNQTDQDTLPPYEVLDDILKAYIEDLKCTDEIIAMGHNPSVVKKVIQMIQKNEYKRRQAAPGLRVTSKAFGMGRRFPIACKF